MEVVLITGVGGLLGSRFSKWLIDNKRDVRVVGIDDFSGGYEDFVDDEVTLYKRDLAEDDIQDIFEVHKPKYVYHFAAYAAEGLSPFIRKFNYKTNMISNANVINECIRHDVERVIFTSSMAVYGRGNPPFDEDEQPSPVDPYGIAKYGCELDFRVAEEQHGLDYCIIRPHNVYGINQNIWDRYRNVLGICMYNLMNGGKITVFGDGSQKRAFTFMDDINEPLWESAVSPKASKQIINVGGPVSCTILEAAETLQEVVGYGEIEFLENRHEVKYAWSTHEKSEEILGYTYKTKLREGLKKMWDWAQEQPKRPRQTWDSYELDKGIYDFWKNK